jgi:Outer membrane protein beta-barrel domain
MKMNKVLLAVGLLSAGVAVGQTTTTNPSSTTTSTSNYNTSNTSNENSRNATLQTNSSTNRPTSTTGSSYNSTSSNTGNNMGTSGMSTGSYSNSSAVGSGSYNNNMGTGTNSMGTSTNSMGTGTNNMGTGTTSGSYNTNSVGTGTSATTPSTTTDYNTGTSNTYSTQTTTTTRPEHTKDYKNFAYGIYAGLNSTRFRGEDLNADDPVGRVGYQAGFFVRGGGRLYGQIGAEYFASSSNYFRPGDGQSVEAIRDQINIQYIQVPVYIGYKLTESDRGISAIRVQVGAEYANRISSNSGQFDLSNSEIKSGSFNALGQLGFDIGPFLIDLTYHHGLSDAVRIDTFQGSTRRILSASVGFKF